MGGGGGGERGGYLSAGLGKCSIYDIRCVLL